MPGWFMRLISSGLDLLVWQEERPGTEAVRNRTRMERIMVFIRIGCVVLVL